MPFMAFIGAEAVHASADAVTPRLAWDPARCTAGGVLHGGALRRC